MGKNNFWEDDALPVAQKPQGGSFWEDDAQAIQQDRLPEQKDFLQDKIEGFQGYLSHVGKDVPVLGPLATKAGNAIAAAGVKATDLLTGQNHGAYGDVYENITKQDQAGDRQFSKEHPVASFGSSVSGGAMLPVPGTKFAEAIPAGGKIVGAAKTLLGAAENVAPQAALSYGDTALRTDSTSKAEEAATNTAKLGMALQLAPKVLSAAGRGATRLMTGIKGDTIDKYKARREAINSLSEEDAIQQIEDATRKVGEKGSGLIEKAKTGAEAAKVQGLSEADEIMRGVADSLQEGVKGARKKISASSSEAFDVLEKSGTEIPLRYIKGSVTQRLENLKIGDALPDSPEVRELTNFRQFLDDIGEKELSAADFKRLIQDLDTRIEDQYAKLGAGQHISSGGKALIATRKGLDQQLKDPERGISGYAEAMEPTARQTKAMQALSEEFPVGGDAAYSKLRTINQPGSRDRLQTLQNFENEFGGDYTKRLQAADELRGRDFAAPFASDMAEGTRISEAAKAIPRNVQAAMRRGGGNPKGNIDLMRRFDRLGEEYNAIAPEAGLNPRQMLDDLAVKRAFETSFAQGSRNVNLGAFSVSGAAKALGVQLDKIPMLAGIGALIGAAADRGGPQAVKAFLDTVDHPAAKKALKEFDRLIRQNPYAVERGVERLSEETAP